MVIVPGDATFRVVKVATVQLVLQEEGAAQHGRQGGREKVGGQMGTTLSDGDGDRENVGMTWKNSEVMKSEERIKCHV